MDYHTTHVTFVQGSPSPTLFGASPPKLILTTGAVDAFYSIGYQGEGTTGPVYKVFSPQRLDDGAAGTPVCVWLSYEHTDCSCGCSGAAALLYGHDGCRPAIRVDPRVPEATPEHARGHAARRAARTCIDSTHGSHGIMLEVCIVVCACSRRQPRAAVLPTMRASTRRACWWPKVPFDLRRQLRRCCARECNGGCHPIRKGVSVSSGTPWRNVVDARHAVLRTVELQAGSRRRQGVTFNCKRVLALSATVYIACQMALNAVKSKLDGLDLGTWKRHTQQANKWKGVRCPGGCRHVTSLIRAPRLSLARAL